MYIFLFVHADSHDTSFFAISNCIWGEIGLENGQFFILWNFLKISQYVLQKSEFKKTFLEKMNVAAKNLSPCRLSRYMGDIQTQLAGGL